MKARATWRCACPFCLCYARVDVPQPCDKCRKGYHTKNTTTKGTQG